MLLRELGGWDIVAVVVVVVAVFGGLVGDYW